MAEGRGYKLPAQQETSRHQTKTSRAAVVVFRLSSPSLILPVWIFH